jgi:PAS domain S-box-containing protein
VLFNYNIQLFLRLFSGRGSQVKSLSSSLSRTFLGLITFIIVLIAFVIPASYFAISYQYLGGSIDAEIHLSALAIEKMVQNNPQLWHFEEIRLQEAMRNRLDPDVKDTRTIRGLNGQILARIDEPLAGPLMSRSQPIYDSGVRVATLEITRSILPLVQNTILIIAGSTLLAILLFFAFRIFPPRSVRQAYRAILQNHYRLRRAEEVANLGSVEYFTDTEILRVSAGAARIFGFSGEDRRLSDIFDITLPEYHAHLQKALTDLTENGKSFIIKYKIRKASDGTLVDILSYAEYDSGNRSAFGVVQDITDLAKAEEETIKLEAQLLQSQKMETVGQLAGGIAHDFNNILTAISGFSFLLKLDIKDNPAAARRVEHILAAVDRAADLTQNLLTFSRKQINNPQPVSLNETILSARNMLESMIGERIKIELHLTGLNTSALADDNQIIQVLMNLAANARDAMPDGGTITIGTERTRIDDLLLKMHEYESTGNYIAITFSDTGCGMPEKTRQRIFEPFFTTKEAGKGTGLGLSMVYGIVKRHKGFIDVQSEHGSGSVFTIFLPALDMKIEKSDSDLVFQYEHFTETVLVADDDSSLRQALGGMLKAFGFTVIEANSGAEAVSKFREMKDAIHLILMDVIMSGKNGIEAYKEILSIRPDVKIIFISGYSINNLSDSLVMEDRVSFISKPISPKKLFDKMQIALRAGTN